MSHAVKMGERVFEPGTKQVVALPVTQDLDGTQITLHVHVLTGREPGPRLALLSTLHGGEWLSIEMFRRLVERLDPAQIKGTLIVVPVGNPVALQQLSRNTPDQSDAPDLNRVFPGEFTWIAEQLAKTITENVIKNADCVIDFHSGGWGRAMGTVMYGTDFDEEITARSREMALAWGHLSVQGSRIASSFAGPKAACSYAGRILRIPNMVAEVLGAGFDQADEEAWVEGGIQGIHNVMIHLGMLEGEMKLPDKYLVWSKRWRVNPSVGGYLEPALPTNSLMREVKKGEVLARVVSPYTNEVLETLASPGDGVIFMTGRGYPVRPGDWAYCVIDLNDKDTRWIDNPLRARV